MICWHNLLVERPSRPSSSFQNLLFKAIFEHCLDYAQVASMALASKSIQSSSLSPNFASKIIIDNKSVIFEAVFHPSTSLPLQFVPELRLNGFVQLFQDLIQSTKYFTKSLRKLTLTNFPMSRFVTIAENCNFTGLTNLEILFCTMSEADADFINSPDRFPCLENLGLWVVDDPPPRKMFGPKLKSIWCLNFSGGNSLLHGLTSDATALRTLNLTMTSSSEISDQGFANIDRLQQTLTTLELSRAERVTWNGLKNLTSLTNLTSLNLRSLLVKNDEIDWATLLSAFPQLTHLDLSNCNVNDETFRQISQLKRLRCLNLTSVKLFLSGVGGADALIEKYLTLLSATLMELNLKKWVALSCSGLSSLAALTNVTNLNLAFCSTFNDDVMQKIAERMPRLKILEIDQCEQVKFTNKSGVVLNQFHSLESIGVGWLLVDDPMLSTFPASFPQLKTLDLKSQLSHSRISDIGLEHISNLPSIESLSLERCVSFTNYGLKVIFCRLLRLNKLNISRCGDGVTDEVFTQCLDHVRRRLSRLEINFSKNITTKSVRLLRSNCPHLALHCLGIGEEGAVAE